VADNEEDEDSNEDEDNPEKKMESDDDEGSEGGRSDNDGGEEEGRSDSEGGEEEEALTQKKHQDEADEYDNYFGDRAAGFDSVDDQDESVGGVGIGDKDGDTGPLCNPVEFALAMTLAANPTTAKQNITFADPNLQQKIIADFKRESGSGRGAAKGNKDPAPEVEQQQQQLDTDEENRLKAALPKTNLMVILKEQGLLTNKKQFSPTVPLQSTGKRQASTAPLPKKPTALPANKPAKKSGTSATMSSIRATQRLANQAKKSELERRLQEAREEEPEIPETPSPTKKKSSNNDESTPIKQTDKTLPLSPVTAASYQPANSSSLLSNAIAVAVEETASSHRQDINRYLVNREMSEAANNLIADVDFRDGLQTLRDGADDDKLKLVCAVALAAINQAHQTTAVVSFIILIHTLVLKNLILLYDKIVWFQKT
jgi:hypothetical protein